MLPTNRALLLLLIAVPIMALGAWLPFMEWIAWGYVVIVLSVLFIDWRMAGDIKQFDLTRQHDTKLSLRAENPIRISLRNRSWRGISFTVRDEAPEQFKIETRTMEGQVAPRGEWESVYHVRPLRRGDYQFGDLSLRWAGPLGLVIRQAKVDAKEPVKVYPNLLDVRRYDLLLKRNRLQEMGLRTTRQFDEGTAFERLREYLPDDEYRRIDWKATARRNFIAPPNGESFKDTVARVIPYFEKEIVPKLKAGKNIVIAAHGNSLRALIMYLEKLTPEQLLQFEIGTAEPRLYELDTNMNVTTAKNI